MHTGRQTVEHNSTFRHALKYKRMQGWGRTHTRGRLSTFVYVATDQLSKTEAAQLPKTPILGTFTQGNLRIIIVLSF